MTVALPTPATTHLANIPSPDRGVWFLGPVPIRAYALCIIVGIIIAIFWAERRWVARGGRKGAVTDIAVFAVPFGLVGGRLYHVITDYWRYFGADSPNPWWGIFQIWQGGLGIWGAVALGAVGAWIGCRRRGVPLPAFADAVAPGLVVAQAVGRLGNYFNQELYGGRTDLPWGLEIYQREPDPVTGVAVSDVPVEVVHPTFLYELLWNLLVALLIVWADRKFRMGHGRVFALYVAGYTAGRFWIEMMRTDPASTPFDLGIRVNVYVSALVFLLAVVYLLLSRRGREEPHLLLGKPMPGDPDYGTGNPVPQENGESGQQSGRGSVTEETFESERAGEDDPPDSSSEHGATGRPNRTE
ncbi:prolipoprotein diacylglyceryl transferase [Actinopolyspora halophila]|uniref:prolipoprotein diacylglyceryl transferase n=1 Tax=Actinopolyspora halophila TaxID=1850 RepID=UPI0003616777|nr:prolipoprotein diacylglyceryl transferase [Actinopolyspora halophila]